MVLTEQQLNDLYAIMAATIGLGSPTLTDKLSEDEKTALVLTCHCALENILNLEQKALDDFDAVMKLYEPIARVSPSLKEILDKAPAIRARLENVKDMLRKFSL